MLNFLKLIFNPDLFTFYFGGGGGQPTQNTSYQTNIPEYAEPYVTTMLGATEKQLYKYDPSGNIIGFQPYKAYTDYDRARGGTGETVAGFTPMQVAGMRGIQNYQIPQQGAFASQMAGSAGLGSMLAGQNYQSMATNPYATQAYMSPYMENALAPQMREAARQSAIQGQQNQAQAVQQGAFGGSRSAIVEAERQRNLGQQQADIYGKGMQTAFEQARQAQQFGSELGLKGYGQGIEGAKLIGDLGQQRYGQELGLLGRQLEVGGQQQQFEQQRLNQIIQDYATSQQYPLMQLGVLSNMLRGLPMQAATTQMYQAQPSAFSQGAGALGTGMALYGQAKQAGFNVAEGGHITEEGVKKYAKGGITGEFAVSDIVSKLSDAQLDAQLKNPNSPPEVKEAAAKETQRRAELRGMAGGGVVAFKNGKEVKDQDLDSKMAQVQTQNLVDESARAIEEDKARKATLRESVRGAMRNPDLSTPFDKPRGVTTMADMEAAAKQGAKPTAPVPKDNAVTKAINQGILGAIQKQPVSGAVQGADTTPVEAPVASKENQGTGGLDTAPKGILTGPPKVEGEAAPAPAPAKAPAPTDAESELTAYAAAQKLIKDRTPEEQARITREERKNLGIVSPYAGELEKTAEKKRKIEAGAKDEYMDRLAEFLMTWGSLPGPTLVAANQAGRMFIANSISDKKERKRLLDGLDASATAVNQAQYLENLGDYKDAEAKIQAAGKIFFEVNEKLQQSTLKKAEFKNAMDRTMATLSSEEARATAKLQMEKALKEMEVNKRTDFMNQVEMRVKAMIKEGAPNDASTINKAMTDVLELTKGTDANMMRALAAITSSTASVAQASAAQTNAITNQQKAATDKSEGLRKLEKDLAGDIENALVYGVTKENKAALRKAREKDEATGIDISSPKSAERAERARITNEVKAKPAYAPLFEAPAPAPAAAEPKKDAAPAAAPKGEAKPTLRWNSKTNQFE